MHSLLVKHPQICRPSQPEINFFSSDVRFRKGYAFYKTMFRGCFKAEASYIDTSSTYLSQERVPFRMNQTFKDQLRDKRIIILLPEPVAKEYSAFAEKAYRCLESMMIIIGNQESPMAGWDTNILCSQDTCRWLRCHEKAKYVTQANISTGIASFQEMFRRGFLKLQSHIYVDHLKKYTKFFDPKQLLVLNSETYHRETAVSMLRIAKFLKFNRTWWNSITAPVSMENRSALGGGSVWGVTPVPVPPLDCETRDDLRGVFREANSELYQFLLHNKFPDEQGNFDSFSDPKGLPCTASAMLDPPGKALVPPIGTWPVPPGTFCPSRDALLGPKYFLIGAQKVPHTPACATIVNCQPSISLITLIPPSPTNC